MSNARTRRRRLLLHEIFKKDGREEGSGVSMKGEETEEGKGGGFVKRVGFWLSCWKTGCFIIVRVSYV